MNLRKIFGTAEERKEASEKVEDGEETEFDDTPEYREYLGYLALVDELKPNYPQFVELLKARLTTDFEDQQYVSEELGFKVMELYVKLVKRG